MNRSPIPIALLAAALLAACQDSAPDPEAQAPDAPVHSADSVPAPPPTAAAPAAGAMIDPDRASREELLTVPGFTPAVADALIQGRPYADMRAVDRVLAAQNLTEQQREAAYARLWKPLDLNSASGEEILLIPGVGERMEHEFEEYRPYRSIEQFRREIGKYVNDEEVARLERYVTIR